MTEQGDVPEYPAGGDPRRRQRLHHIFRRRRRWSAELDRLCGIEGPRSFRLGCGADESSEQDLELDLDATTDEGETP
jgi:hypothetical protein